MNAPTLRSYQIEAKAAVLKKLAIESTNRQVLMLCTGSGKSVISASIVMDARDKGLRAAFVVPRTVLIDQMSAHLDALGVEHGVQQSDHWRNRPYDPIQLCSAQTLARRGFPNGLDLVVIDEAHLKSKAVIDFITKDRSIKVIGLTATPFSKGMADIYDGIVCSVTQNDLTDLGFIVPLKVYCGVSADMEKILVKSTGEWDAAQMASAQSELVGDVITTWQDKTLKHFGGPVKTIAFGPTVDYCKELAHSFTKAGFRFEVVSYHENGEERKALFDEFRKPDSKIIGLISCEALREGLDVPDVMALIDCHAYRKSRQAVQQMWGRVMRAAPGKDYGLLLDHAGNYIRHGAFLEKIAAEGAKALKGGLKANEAAFKPEKEDKVAEKKKERTCPQCSSLLKLFSNGCSECGWVKPVVPKYIQTTGKMLTAEQVKALSKNQQKKHKAEMNREYASIVATIPQDALIAQLKGYAAERYVDDPTKGGNWVKANFKSITGKWLPNEHTSIEPAQPSVVLMADITAKRKLWAVQQRFKRRF